MPNTATDAAQSGLQALQLHIQDFNTDQEVYTYALKNATVAVKLAAVQQLALHSPTDTQEMAEYWTHQTVLTVTLGFTANHRRRH